MIQYLDYSDIELAEFQNISLKIIKFELNTFNLFKMFELIF